MNDEPRRKVKSNNDCMQPPMKRNKKLLEDSTPIASLSNKKVCSRPNYIFCTSVVGIKLLPIVYGLLQTYLYTNMVAKWQAKIRNFK